MQFVTARDFVATRAWDALPIAEIEGVTIRLHWTNRSYIWHVNDGAEVFVLLDGAVTMHYRRDGCEYRRAMQSGDICHAEPGDEHVAHPEGAARILVIEKKGSV
ncbi:MAG TPA: cupin [Dongiaceae bacterium]|jgi:mannose-6-phosphate isomerase-like protein (cupin superfamily)|nr:cupin [Dongiaceae bacterium]